MNSPKLLQLSIMNDPKQWINLKGNKFTESETGWYNLRSGRSVTKPPSAYSPIYGLKGIKVIGTLEDVTMFWNMNPQKLQQGKTLEALLFKPFEDIKYLSDEACQRSQLCFIGTAGSVIAASTTTDVSALTQQQLDSMCTFTFAGLFVKARVDRVIDGDTFEIVFYVPLVLLGRARGIGDKGAPRTSMIPTRGYEQTGFFTKVMVRMYGYDAAEKDTEAGKLAKQLMEEKFRSLGGIVWCQFIETNIANDKYGRTLVVMYGDENRTQSVNDYLLSMESKHNIKMVYPYLGGKKESFN